MQPEDISPPAPATGASSVTLDANQVRTVIRLLEVLAQVPSTPEPIAAEAYQHAGRLLDHIPHQPRHDAGSRQSVGAVELVRELVIAVAGLLDLLSEMPSTPPGVSDDAEAQAARLWELVDRADGG